MDVVSLLTDQADRTSKAVRDVRPDQFELPTPCTGWDVRRLINHLCMTSQFCARVAAGEKVEPDYETDFVGDDPADAYDRWKDEMLVACAAPGLGERTVHMPIGDVPGAVVLALALMDTVVHRWDLTRAVGADPHISADAAGALLEQIRPMIPEAMRAPTPDATTGQIPFGPQVDVPEGAPAIDQLMGFLGRAP